MIKKWIVKILFVSFVQSFKNRPKFMPLDQNTPVKKNRLIVYVIYEFLYLLHRSDSYTYYIDLFNRDDQIFT